MADLRPTNFTVQTNCTGSTSDISNDPDSGLDGNWVLADGDHLDTTLEIQFDATTGVISGTQSFKLLLRESNVGKTPDDVYVYLYEGTSVVRELAHYADTSWGSGGSGVLDLTWDASELSSQAPGVDARCRIVCYADSSPPTQQSSLDVNAVEFVAAYASATEIESENSTHAHTCTKPATTQAQTLEIQNATQAHNATAPAAKENTNHPIADGAHAHVSGQPSITETQGISIQRADHAHTTTDPGLVQTHVLGAQDASQGHLAQAPAVTEDHNTAIADSEHAHSVESPQAASLATTIEAANGVHNHATTASGVTQQQSHAIADTTHAHSAQSPLARSSTQIESENAVHALDSAAPGMTQHHHLSTRLVTDETMTDVNLWRQVNPENFNVFEIDGNGDLHIQAKLQWYVRSDLQFEELSWRFKKFHLRFIAKAVADRGFRVELYTSKNSTVVPPDDAWHEYVEWHQQYYDNDPHVRMRPEETTGSTYYDYYVRYIEATKVYADRKHAVTDSGSTLSQWQSIEIADSTHAQTVAQPDIHGHWIYFDEPVHAHAAQSPSLWQLHPVQVQNNAHGVISTKPQAGEYFQIWFNIANTAHASQSSAPGMAHTHVIGHSYHHSWWGTYENDEHWWWYINLGEGGSGTHYVNEDDDLVLEADADANTWTKEYYVDVDIWGVLGKWATFHYEVNADSGDEFEIGWQGRNGETVTDDEQKHIDITGDGTWHEDTISEWVEKVPGDTLSAENHVVCFFLLYRSQPTSGKIKIRNFWADVDWLSRRHIVTDTGPSISAYQTIAVQNADHAHEARSPQAGEWSPTTHPVADSAHAHATTQPHVPINYWIGGIPYSFHYDEDCQIIGKWDRSEAVLTFDLDGYFYVTLDQSHEIWRNDVPFPTGKNLMWECITCNNSTEWGSFSYDGSQQARDDGIQVPNTYVALNPPDAYWVHQYKIINATQACVYYGVLGNESGYPKRFYITWFRITNDYASSHHAHSVESPAIVETLNYIAIKSTTLAIEVSGPGPGQQKHRVWPADNTHLHTATSPSAGELGTSIELSNGIHVQTAAVPSITQYQTIPLAKAEHAQSATVPGVTQNHVVPVSSALHVHSATMPLATEIGSSILVSNGTHAQAATQPGTSGYQWVEVAWAIQAHSAASCAITQWQDIGIAGSTHTHASGAPAIEGVHYVIPDDALHAHVAGGMGVSGEGAVPLANGLHTHAATNPGLSQWQAIPPQDAVHSFAVVAYGIAQGHVFAVTDNYLSHSCENCRVSLHTSLGTADCAHTHTAGTPSIAMHFGIAVERCELLHSAASPGFVQYHVVGLADAFCAHVANPLDFTQWQNIACSDTYHAQMADMPSSIFIGRHESRERTLAILQENRTLWIGSESRCITVSKENRTLRISPLHH